MPRSYFSLTPKKDKDCFSEIIKIVIFVSDLIKWQSGIKMTVLGKNYNFDLNFRLEFLLNSSLGRSQARSLQCEGEGGRGF